MNERLLQFIWQYQYFNKNELQITSGKQLKILHQGILNADQGPDFSDARIAIEQQLWAGNIELHIYSTDWKRHHHQTDSNYTNVILHVVWIDDETTPTNDIPVFEISGRVPKTLLAKYEAWMHTYTDFIPCSAQINSIDPTLLNTCFEEMIHKRLNARTQLMAQKLKENHYHWDQVFWSMLVRNFGIRVNADAFEAIAKTLPLNLLIKHKNQIHALEAMLLGQAGLLEIRFSEKYPLLLQKEYSFYKKKYGLRPIHQRLHFLRMRPVNFPSIRLAQLAMFIHTSPGFFSFARECEHPDELRAFLTVTANDYWNYHYRLDEPSSFQPKQTGKEIIDSIFINTVVPVFFAYGNINNLPYFTEKALNWLRIISAENNPITRGFKRSGIKAESALYSQAMLQLKIHFCDHRKCLECMIGTTLLKQTGRAISKD